MTTKISKNKDIYHLICVSMLHAVPPTSCGRDTQRTHSGMNDGVARSTLGANCVSGRNNCIRREKIVNNSI